MGLEEGARFYVQVQAEQRKLLEIGRQAPVLQAIPIGNLDPAPKWQYQKRKIHRKADAQGQNGAEIAKKELKPREATAAASRERTAVTPDDSGEDAVVLDTPPMPAGEYQGGTSITSGLPIRTIPEDVRRAPPPQRAPPTSAPMWRPFLKSPLIRQRLQQPQG